MTAAQLFCKYVNLSLMLTDSLYWLGIYQIELDGLHDWCMCSLILQVVRCDVSGVYLISVSGGCWLTAVNISQHNLNHLSHTSAEDGRLKKIIFASTINKEDIFYTFTNQWKTTEADLPDVLEKLYVWTNTTALIALMLFHTGVAVLSEAWSDLISERKSS